MATSPILDAPIREPEDSFTEQQWTTLLAIFDAISPSVRPQTDGDTAEDCVLSEEEYKLTVTEIQEQLQNSPEFTDTDTYKFVDDYLNTSPSKDPGVRRSVNLHVQYFPPDTKHALATFCSGLNRKATLYLLTGSSIPFHQQPLSKRRNIIHKWAKSKLTSLRLLVKALNILVRRGMYLGSPLTQQMLGFPLKPNNYVQPTNDEDYPFQFIQIPPGDGPEVIDTDVVIVGSGCGAGVAAKNLAEAGHRVVVVEQAYRYSRQHFPMESSQAFDNLYKDYGCISSNDSSIGVVAAEAWGGGGSVNFSAALQTQAFVREEWAKKDKLPFFTSADYQQCMDRVSEYMGCSTENIEHNHANNMILEGARRLGFAAAPVPQNTNKRRHNCGHCLLGCSTGAKQSPAVSWLCDAAEAGARFLEGCSIDQILFDDDKNRRSVKGVRGTWRSRDETNGTHGTPVTTRQVQISAKRVIVAGGTLQSPLLLSRSGLKNKNIGKNLHLHPVVPLACVFDHKIDPWDGSALTSVISEIENLDRKGYGARVEAVPAIPSIMLATIPFLDPKDQKMFQSRTRNTVFPISIIRDRDSGRVTPDPKTGQARMDYTPSLHDRKHSLEGIIASAKVAYITGAREIRVACRDIPPFVRKDPTPLTTSDAPFTSCEGDGINDPDFQDWIAKVRSLERRSSTLLNPERTTFVSAHIMGTCKMGSSPKKSVVNPEGQVWGVDGLYVSDASVFPSATGVNPMMTVYAISDWISRHVSKSLRKM